MTPTLSRHPSGDIEITIPIAWSTISTSYDTVVDQMTKDVELPGFRKGKAPRKLAAETLNKDKVYEEVVRKVVPQAYADTIKELSLRPIVTPDVHLKDAQEGKDWVIICHTCEKPKPTIGEYRKPIQELKAGKRNTLWVPGKGEKAQAEKQEEAKKPTLDELLSAFLSAVTVTIPNILISSEVNRQLSSLVDQTRKLGLTVEQYLASSGRTSEGLRKEYEEQARRMLSLEFSLEVVADQEHLTVSDTDVETVLKTAKSEVERKALEAQRYYLSSLIRRQKVIDFLAAL